MKKRHPCPDFAGIVPATRALIAAPGPRLASSQFNSQRVPRRAAGPARPRRGPPVAPGLTGL